MKSTALRQSFAKGGKRHKAAMHLIPNLFTTGNLFCGVFSILSVFNANYMAAAVAILVAMVFDVLDGKSARLTNSTSHFGLEYDSLSDVVSFGVAPGLLLYSWALSGQGTFGIAVMFAYVAMGAVRLARFNSTASLSDSKYFTGLAIPAAAGVVADSCASVRGARLFMKAAVATPPTSNAARAMARVLFFISGSCGASARFLCWAGLQHAKPERVPHHCRRHARNVKPGKLRGHASVGHRALETRHAESTRRASPAFPRAAASRQAT